MFTLGVLAVALGIAFGSAALFGVSLALGAFVAGVVVGETDLSHQAAADALPLRDAFAVLFFVSVGMLFDASFLFSNVGHVIAILAIVLLAKPLAAFLIVLALRYPLRTGFTVAASLAQIGEFSFILADVSLGLGLLPPEGYSLVIVGALLSIALNPLMFRALDLLETWVRRRPKLTAYLEPYRRDLTTLDREIDGELRGHTVLCGYGRVGSVIGEALERRGFHYVVLEQNRRLVDELRERDIPALYGDAANPTLLSHVNLGRARILLIAIPDPVATRQIVEYARGLNPDLEIIARTHSEQEWRYLSNGLVTEALLAERELAIEMISYVLRRYGVSPPEVLAVMRGLRRRDAGAPS
jgi:CPA2 family monovalent cation:H+ antiporter-2